MSGNQDWLKRLPDRLEPPSQAIKLALEDVIEVSESPSVGWLDTSDELMTLYILASGSLHRLIGKPDPIRAPSGPAEPFVSTCEYRAVPITGDSRYSLTVTSKSLINEAGTLNRKWTFEVAGFGQFDVESPPAGKDRATSFARALAAEIGRAGARAAGA
jgi:hypothetical protein